MGDLAPIGQLLICPTGKENSSELINKQSNRRRKQTAPEPETCQFCRAVLSWRKKEIPELKFTTWFRPERCTCLGAQEHWAEADRLFAEEEARQREKEARQRKHMLLEISRLPKRYWTCSFATATSTLENQAAIEKVKVYAENFTGRGGVFLLGPVGTGKTHMVACMIDSLTSRGIRALFGNVLDLLGRLRRSYDDGAQEEEWRIIDELASAPLLVIDDLGKEKVSGWVEQTLYRIVDMRYRENRALVVTSNFTLSELEKRYNDVGSALISRIAEMCEGVRLGGKDWRRS